MNTRRIRGVTLGAGIGSLCSLLMGCGIGNDAQQRAEASAAATHQAVQSLKDTFPAARLENSKGKLSSIYGASLTTGATPDESAEQFRHKHAAAFGVSPDELTPQELLVGKTAANASPKPIGLMYDRATQQYKFWLYRYGQTKGSVPVFRGALWTLVKNSGSNPVVWASSSLHDVSSFVAPTAAALNAADTAKTLRAIRGSTDITGRHVGPPTKLTSISRPTQTVFAGTEDTEAPPKLAVEYDVQSESPPGKWHVVADSVTGDVLHIEDLLVFDNVNGSVAGNVTAGDKAADCGNEVPTPFPYAEVTGPSGTAFTDLTGAFTLPSSGTTAISITSGMGGQYFDIFNYSGSVESLSLSVAPPGPADFLHNSADTDAALIAQANAYSQSNEIRAFLLKYLPSYPVISTQSNFPVYVNRNDGYCPGNAWYDPAAVSLNLCVGSTSYANTSFASVTHHEFGHHVVQSGGSGQGAYGEGMGDVLASLYAGDPGLGYGFYLNQCTAPLRNADNTCQYSATACSSCGSEVHACGNLLSGTIWSVRKELAKSYPSTYADLLNSLVISSIPMHKGTAIDSSIAVNLLTLDDDNANLDDGSPHYKEICAGFAAHGMTCPPLLTGLSVVPTTNLTSEGALGGPFTPANVVYTVKNLGPTSPVTYQVGPATTTPWLNVTNASGQLAVGEQALVTVAINQATAAGLAKGGYDSVVNFINATDNTGNTTRTAHLQVGVPSAVYSETFEAGLGGFSPSTGTTNLWHSSTACSNSLSGHSGTHSLYFGIVSSCNYSNGLVVSGTATSPSVLISDTSLVKLRFNYFLGTEKLSTWDKATAKVSINGGAFTVVASNNSGGIVLQDGTGAWQAAEVDLTSLLSGISTANIALQFGFDSVDSVANTYAGFYVDDVQLLAFSSGCTTDAQCDDGKYCNGSELCSSGACQPGTAVNCGDSVSCTIDTCDETTKGCTHKADSTLCDDGQICNGAELCDPTSGCVPGTPVSCDDGNPCTTDTCDANGCKHVTISCDDGNPCTTDTCDANGCKHVTISCDDGNACTTDSCDATNGCTHVAAANGAACTDDGNSCTNDVCSAGACTHPSNGTCGATPCSNICSNPVKFSGNYQSGSLGSGVTCFETTVLHGGNCGNFVSPRTLKINGTTMSCNNQNWSTLPAKVNGGWCVTTTAGNYPWAYFATW